MAIVVSLPRLSYRHVPSIAYHCSTRLYRMQVAAVAIGVDDPTEGRIGQFPDTVTPSGVVRATEMQLGVSGIMLRGGNRRLCVATWIQILCILLILYLLRSR
jgi:hypothetical protein